MVFNREWDTDGGGYIINRENTGPPKPKAQTGTTVVADGAIVVANQAVTPSIPPSTPVVVDFPGPREPLVMSNGMISARWWRFFDQMYRRTGGIVDNINRVPMTYYFPTTVAMTITGYAPTLDMTDLHRGDPTVGTISIASEAPLVF